MTPFLAQLEPFVLTVAAVISALAGLGLAIRAADDFGDHHPAFAVVNLVSGVLCLAVSFVLIHLATELIR